MPTDAKMKEAIENLKKVDNKVDYNSCCSRRNYVYLSSESSGGDSIKIFWNGYGRMSYIDIGIWTIYTVRRMCGGIKRYFGLM
mgnify:CR=1 FL=1